MSAVGLVINASFDESTPRTREYTDLGFGPLSIHRTVIQGPLEPILDRAWASLPHHSQLFVTLNNECHQVRSDWSGLEDACTIIARRYRDLVWGVGIGNELDIWYTNDDSCSPKNAAELVRRASGILHAAGFRVAPTSVASGFWQSYLEQLAPLVREWIDFVDLHLYVKDAGGVMPGWQTMQDALEEAHRISGMPVISSEGGIKEDDAGGKEQQALWAANFFTIAQTLPADTFPWLALFSWHDRIGTASEQGGQSFGLRNFVGDKEPSWYTVQRTLGGPQAVAAARTIPVSVGDGFIGPGFRAWALLEPHIVGEIIEPKEGGAVDGLSQILTTNGVMTWADLRTSGPTLAFVNTTTRERRYWREEWPQSKVRVIA